jgi:hypothetical protein
MDAGTAIVFLPANVQELFSHVDPELTVCMKQYRNRIEGSANHCKTLFKGGR